MFIKIFKTFFNGNSWNWEIISNMILSAVAVVISVIAVVKTSIDNNKILEANSRAYLSIYTETLIANKNHFYIVIRNFGNTNAFIQNIDIDDKTKQMIKLGNSINKDYFDNITKTQLAPGQSITHIVMTHNESYDYNHISKFEISYTSGGKKYSDNFEFNLSLISTMPSVSIVTDGTNEKFNKHFLELYEDQIRKNL